jgi:uracil-DNA glycosylase
MIGNDWDNVLQGIYESDYFIGLLNNIDDLYSKETIYPLREDLFNALKLTPYKSVKVVILGQDPYHGEGEAHGLSFSVKSGVKIPPSLKNIYKELDDDLGIKRVDGDLSNWASEGVLLLNSILTVEKDKPLSHKRIGWEEFTDYIISTLNLSDTPKVFILWGNFAKEKSKLITNKKHLVITSSHPSPFSCNKGFFHSRPFSKTNEFLKKNNITEVRW